jgi:hypothetical protein
MHVQGFGVQDNQEDSGLEGQLLGAAAVALDPPQAPGGGTLTACFSRRLSSLGQAGVPISLTGQPLNFAGVVRCGRCGVGSCLSVLWKPRKGGLALHRLPGPVCCDADMSQRCVLQAWLA